MCVRILSYPTLEVKEISSKMGGEPGGVIAVSERLSLSMTARLVMFVRQSSIDAESERLQAVTLYSSSA